LALPSANKTYYGRIYHQVYHQFRCYEEKGIHQKGLACRFSCVFKIDGEFVLEYVGENSYVIDFEDVIDKAELLKMIRNAFAKYNEKFDFRKLGTVLSSTSLSPLNESSIDLDAILPLLV